MPQVGSVRKRGRAMPQKLRRSRMRQDGRLFVAAPAGSLPGPRGCSRVLLRQRGMLADRMIEDQPQRHPDQADQADDDEGRLPGIVEDRPGDQGRRHHRAQWTARYCKARPPSRAPWPETIPTPLSARRARRRPRRSPAGRAGRPASASWPARPCAMQITDQRKAKIAKPVFTPRMSMT